jgi:predicted Zn-dependent protease
VTDKEIAGGPVEELHFFLLGSLSPSLGESAVAAVSRQISVPCRLEGGLSLQDMPMIEGRRQADADALLHALEHDPRHPGRAVVGMTGVDIGTRIFRFVFGRARRGGNAAVVSMARLDPQFYGMPADPGLTMRRFATEILHELGHLAGLGHCKDFSCRMHFVANVESLDLRGNGLCAPCKELEAAGRRRIIRC